MSTRPRVCILTAGMGSRMGEFSQITNKALLPIDHKAIISHIIEKFPQGTEFVISLGHLADQVHSYLILAHPAVIFHFCTVDKFTGDGSGPAHSLAACKTFLNDSFYFVACDTLWNEPFDLSPASHSWFATAPVAPEISSNYCNFQIDSAVDSPRAITGLYDKQKTEGASFTAFSGLGFIAHPELFWPGLESGRLVKNETQISNGIQALIEAQDAFVRPMPWLDVGDEQKYKAACRAANKDFDFSKTDELLYFVGSRVIKFFRDNKLSERRYSRALQNPSVFPTLVGQGSGFYAYEKVPGQTLYAHNNPAMFKELLHWLEEKLWKDIDVDNTTLVRSCEEFYETKTRQRLKQYLKKYDLDDEPMIVNGQRLEPLTPILDKWPWTSLFEGKPVFFHGDLNFDNILSTTEEDPKNQRPFCLIDWRQDFAGQTIFGDLYYDLAKLLAGLDLNYDYIKKGLFTYQEKINADGIKEIFIDWATRPSSVEYEKILMAYIDRRHLSPDKVRRLTALIYLNMSPLHHEPFDKLLYALGRWKLAQLEV